MKIFIDENIPLMTLRELKVMGHDVIDIRGTSSQGSADKLIWEQTQKEKYLLITTDIGFASHRNEPHHGILIVRLKQPNRYKIHIRVLQAIKQFSAKEWPGLLVIMQDRIQRKWRVRKKR